MDFSKRARRGIIIFLVLVAVVVLIPRAYSLFVEDEKFVFEQTNFEQTKFEKRKKKNFHKFKRSFRNFSKYNKPPKKFDPNTYKQEDWMYLGLSEKQAAIVIKFGKRGFYKEEDLKKIFVINEKFFALIKDSLFFPSKEKNDFKELVKKDIKITFVELNTATYDELLTLKGIGPYFAKGIIKLREKLGGFVKKEQLLEVWKMDNEKYQAIVNEVNVDPSIIQKININEATAEQFKSHPYFDWNMANSIVKLRKQIGGYQKVDDIKRSVLVDENWYKKVEPYLKVE